MFDDLAPFLPSIPPGLRDRVVELRRRIAEDPEPIHVLFDVVQFKMVCHEMSSRSGNPEVLKFAKVSELLFKLARQRAG